MRAHLLSSTTSSLAIAILSASALLLAPTAAHAVAAPVTVGDGGSHTYSSTTDTTATFNGTAGNATGTLTIIDGTTVGANAVTSANASVGANGTGTVGATVGTTGSSLGSGLGDSTHFVNTLNLTGAGAATTGANTLAITGNVGVSNLNVAVTTGANLTVTGTTNANLLNVSNNGHATFSGGLTTATTNTGGTTGITTGASSNFGTVGLTAATSTITANGGGVTNTMGSLSVDGTSNATLAGSGTTAIAGTATVANGGVLSLNSGTANNIGTLAAATGSTVNVNAASTVTTLGAGAGNMNVTGNKLLTVTNGISGAHTFGFASSGNTGGTASSVTTAGANSLDLSGSTVNFNATNTTGAAATTSYTVASATGSGTVVGPASLTFTNQAGGYTYVNHIVGQDLNVVQTQNSAYTGVSTGTNAALSHNSLTTYLQTQVAGSASDTGTMGTYIAGLTAASAGTKSNVLNAAATQTTTQVSNNFATDFMNVISDRTGVAQGTHTASNGDAGMSAGDASSGRAVWLQAFGSTARQDTRGGEAGFDTDDGGFALGFEQKLSQHSTAGLAVSYGAGQFQSNDQFAPKTTSSDDYQASLYGSSYVRPNWYVEGQVGGGYHTFNEGNTYLGIGTASADYHGWGYFGQIGTGYDLHTGTAAIVTPFAKLAYQALAFDSYTESGAGALDRSVGSDTAQTLTGFLGAKIAWQSVTYWGTQFTPELRAAYLHDFEQEGLSTSASFIGTGAGSTYTTSGQGLAKDGFTVGAGLDVAQSNGWNVIANYDYENRDGYNDHSGTLTAKYAF